MVERGFQHPDRIVGSREVVVKELRHPPKPGARARLFLFGVCGPSRTADFEWMFTDAFTVIPAAGLAEQGLGTDTLRWPLRQVTDTDRALSLHVLKANASAAALYEREGLRVVSSEQTRWLMRTQA